MTGLLVLGTMERSRASLLLRQLLIILSKLEQSLWVSLNNVNTVNSLGAQQRLSGPLWELVVSGKSKKISSYWTDYWAFKKYSNFEVQSCIHIQLHFLLPSIIISLLSQAMNLETQKHTKQIKICQSQITNMTFWTSWSKLLFPNRSSKMIESSEKCKHQFAVKRRLRIMFLSEWRLELFKLCTQHFAF